MELYKVKFNAASNEQFQALDQPLLETVVNELHELCLFPRPIKAERLKLRDGYRLRFDGYRLIYYIDEAARLIRVVQIAPTMI